MGAVYVFDAGVGTGAAGRIPEGIGICLDIILVDNGCPTVICQLQQEVGVHLFELQGQLAAVNGAGIEINDVVAGVKLIVFIDKAGEGIEHIVRRQRIAIGEGDIIPDGQLQSGVVNPVPFGGDTGLHFHGLIVQLQNRVIDHHQSQGTVGVGAWIKVVGGVQSANPKLLGFAGILGGSGGIILSGCIGRRVLLGLSGRGVCLFSGVGSAGRARAAAAGGKAQQHGKRQQHGEHSFHFGSSLNSGVSSWETGPVIDISDKSVLYLLWFFCRL